LGILAGAALAAASCIFGWGAFKDWRRFPDSPLPVDLEQAARTAAEGRQWVSVTGGAWQCERAIEHGMYALVPAWTANGTLLVRGSGSRSHASGWGGWTA
jgi:hypothetical protein